MLPQHNGGMYVVAMYTKILLETRTDESRGNCPFSTIPEMLDKSNPLIKHASPLPTTNTAPITTGPPPSISHAHPSSEFFLKAEGAIAPGASKPVGETPSGCGGLKRDDC